MQIIICQPRPVLTQVMSGFGDHREVHEDGTGDGPLHGLAEGDHSNAIKYVGSFCEKVRSSTLILAGDLPEATRWLAQV